MLPRRGLTFRYRLSKWFSGLKKKKAKEKLTSINSKPKKGEENEK